MRETLTAERGLLLLRAMGVDSVAIDRLIGKASVIAAERHSSLLGYRHLLQAAGVIVGRPRTGAERIEAAPGAADNLSVAAEVDES